MKIASCLGLGWVVVEQQLETNKLSWAEPGPARFGSAGALLNYAGTWCGVDGLAQKGDFYK